MYTVTATNKYGQVIWVSRNMTRQEAQVLAQGRPYCKITGGAT